MNTHTAPRPTGRRKITPAQLHTEMAAAATTMPREPGMTPGRALAAFKRAEPALGFPSKVVKLIDYLAGRSQPQDWDGTGLGPIVWPSDMELEDRLCVGATQRKAIVRAALDAGLVRLRRSPNGKRYGWRDKQGRITDAYGFDLSPLAERAAEFDGLMAEWTARRDEGRRLRREITSSRNAVLSLVDLALAQSAPGEDWPTLAARADALWHMRGTQRDPLSLLPIAARLKALLLHVRERLTAAFAPVEYKETDPRGAEYRPHHTTTTKLIIVPKDKRSTFGLGQEERSNDRSDSVSAMGVCPRRESERADALRGFVATPGFVLAIAPMFRAAVRIAGPSWSDLADAALAVCHELGINKHAWGQARILLGQKAAVLAVAAIAARHAKGQVRQPGGLLRAMVDRHGAGTLRLDRTLFGLAADLTRQRDEARP